MRPCAPQAAYEQAGAAYQTAPTDELRGARHLDEGKPWVPGPSRS